MAKNLGKVTGGVEGTYELSAEEVETTQEMADTSTGTAGISQMIGSVWLEEVVRRAEDIRHMEEVSRVYNELVGTGNDTLEIPKTTQHLDISTTDGSPANQGTNRTYTELDNAETVTATIGDSDWYKGGIALPKEVVMTSRVDLIELARYSVSEDMAKDVDTALIDEAQTSAANTITSSGRLTPDAINEAMTAIENNKYVPRYLVVGAGQHGDLRGDSQFTNAAEYGGDDVIVDGIVGNYLGVDVLRSTNIDNDQAIMIGQHPDGPLVGPSLVWKEEPTVEMEYHNEEAEHRVFYNQAFTTVTVEPDAVATIDTS